MQYDRAENKKLLGMLATMRTENAKTKAELSDLKEELNLVSEQRDILATDCDQSKADLTKALSDLAMMEARVWREAAKTYYENGGYDTWVQSIFEVKAEEAEGRGDEE